MNEFDPEHLQLTDFLDLETLQEIQDSFAAIANVKAIITDATGNRLTQAAPTREFLRRQRAIAASEENPDRPQKEGTEYTAPIVVNNQRLGTLRMAVARDGALPLDDAKLGAMAEKLGIDPAKVKPLAQQLNREINKAKNVKPAAIQADASIRGGRRPIMPAAKESAAAARNATPTQVYWKKAINKATISAATAAANR